MHIAEDRTGFDVLRRPGGAPLVRQNTNRGERPYLHPVMAPDGVGEVTENAPAHLPWQHGIYVGLNDVNGIGFWTEGLLPERNHLDGTFDIRESVALNSSAHAAAWQVRTRYREPVGSGVLDETQTWTLNDTGNSYSLDLDWTLTGIVDVTFGQWHYGGPFIRVPFREEVGGTVLTSEGATTNDVAEQKRARWVSLSIPLPERGAEREPSISVSIMDHPANPDFPVPWRVDKQLGVGPSRCILGAWHLAAGETVTHRHRFLVTIGAPEAAVIEASYNDFSQRGTPS